jgi:uncharacterized protein (DUF2062 family)
VRRWSYHVIRRSRELVRSAREERASPPQVGVGTGVGVLACFSPLPWSHVPLALLFATILRVNRAWAVVGSQIPSLFGLLRPVIVFGEIEVAYRLRTGAWPQLTIRGALAEAPRLLVDLCVGSAIVGATAGMLGGLAAYLWARRARAVSNRSRGMPEEPRPPSSGSPPSTPPGPPS